MARWIIITILTHLLGLSLATAQLQRQPSADERPAMLLPGLGQHRHPISTQNPEAQKFFDQGLMMVFGFNRPEAVRSFRRAAELDPHAAMPLWGLALAFGRHLNMDVDFDVQNEEALKGIKKAEALSESASPVERAYISALAKRCSGSAEADWSQIDSAYRDAMRELVKQFPDDLDAAALYADGVMNLHRYRWYGADGKPVAETAEILNVLENIMRRDPDHPLANHLYIHLLDTAPHPEHALASAYRLSNIAPGAGHLVHMPSHIFLTLGDYEMTARVNEQAAKADREYFKLTGVRSNIYSWMYYPHNVHMIVRARSEQGRFDDAKRAVDELVAHQTRLFDDMPMTIDYFLPNSVFVPLRFQRWDDVLKAPEPQPNMHMTHALWHYARALAFCGIGRREKALTEEALLVESRRKIPKDWMWSFNSADSILNLGDIILKARLAANDKTAIEFWKKAVAAQDALLYDEPPAWYYPTRESLGGALLRAHEAAEAEAVFRENLKRYPRNGRSLFGLMESLKAQRKTTDAQWVEQEFEKAWQQSQVRLRIEDL
jgi:tetratricopeptide (TPR) repeat protein